MFPNRGRRRANTSLLSLLVQKVTSEFSVKAVEDMLVAFNVPQTHGDIVVTERRGRSGGGARGQAVQGAERAATLARGTDIGQRAERAVLAQIAVRCGPSHNARALGTLRLAEAGILAVVACGSDRECCCLWVRGGAARSA